MTEQDRTWLNRTEHKTTKLNTIEHFCDITENGLKWLYTIEHKNAIKHNKTLHEITL